MAGIGEQGRKTARMLGLCLALGALQPFVAIARELPAEDFFRLPEFDHVELSPSGEYLAVTVPQDDRTLLAVLRTKDKSIVAKWDYGPRMHPYSVMWVNDERFLVRVAEKTGSFDSPRSRWRFALRRRRRRSPRKPRPCRPRATRRPTSNASPTWCC